MTDSPMALGPKAHRGVPPARARLALERIAHTIEAQAKSGQIAPTPISALSVYAWRGGATHMHLVYRPSLCVVVRGSKLARVGDQIYRYDPAHFFFTAIPLPAELEIRRGRSGALVGLILELDLQLVAQVALEIDDALEGKRTRRQSAETPVVTLTGRMTPKLLNALERLLAVASDPLRHKVLEGSVMREVVLELLVGPEGSALRRAVDHGGRLRGLIDVVRYIDDHSHEPLGVPSLARRAAMSQSAFFVKFRQATGATPLQYLKRLRLTKARVLLSMGTGSVTEVAHAVGYASSAQFSRDFRAAFGSSPSEVLRPLAGESWAGESAHTRLNHRKE